MIPSKAPYGQKKRHQKFLLTSEIIKIERITDSAIPGHVCEKFQHLYVCHTDKRRAGVQDFQLYDRHFDDNDLDKKGKDCIFPGAGNRIINPIRPDFPGHNKWQYHSQDIGWCQIHKNGGFKGFHG